MRRQSSESGHSVVEVALLSPWLFLLFAYVLDLGFYNYAAISVENAARVAALRLMQGGTVDATVARTYVCNELSTLPNVGSTCSSTVVGVAATGVSGPDAASAVQVQVTYTTVALLPLPLLKGQWTFNRYVEAKL